MGVRVATGLLTIVAVGGGDGAIITNAIAAFTQPATPVKVAIRKIMWRNRTVGNANLLIGYGDRTVAPGSLFRRVLPFIFMLAGMDGILTEAEIPLTGNPGADGFFPDTTAVTGTIGNILIETDAAGVAAGTPVEVSMELELEPLLREPT